MTGAGDGSQEAQISGMQERQIFCASAEQLTKGDALLES